MLERGFTAAVSRRARRRRYTPTFVSIVFTLLCLTALALGANRLLKPSSKPLSPAAHSPTAGGDSEYVRRGQIWPSLHGALTATGDRLEKSGKERLTLTGAITRGEGSPPAPLAVIRDYPNRVRVGESGGSTTRVTAFNGVRAQAAGGNMTPAERDTLEMLVYDTADHFFHSQQSGAAATRFLGARFRLDADAGTDNAGPSYDVYETTEQVPFDDAGRVQTRRYYFNSATQLLERVHYETQRDGTQVSVEVVLGGWESVSGQSLPSSIVRLEDGKAVLTINFAQMTVGPESSGVTFNL